MAKRYYNDNARQTRAMEAREYYAGIEGNKAQERRDGSMIDSDYSAPFNLPQQVIMREYPKPDYGINWDLDDNLYGIDNQMGEDRRIMKKGFGPTKV